MKKFIAILSVFIALSSNANIKYIRKDGSDSNNGLTNNSGGAWLTATWAMAHASANDTLFFQTGTWTEAQLVLPVGVSIRGIDTSSTILKSTETADWTQLLIASSAEGTNGNQSIYNIKFDGQSLATDQAIRFAGRSNIFIHHCLFVDFRDRGVVVTGRNDDAGGAPGTYATGFSFTYNVMRNCAEYDHSLDFGAGCLNIGGLEGFDISYNNIQNYFRAEGFNGWPIKGYNEGYLKGGRIHHNYLRKAPLQNTNGFFNWDFCIELFDEYGVEIDNNTLIDGGIDVNHQLVKTYAYSVWIHDNTGRITTPAGYNETAVTLEFKTQKAIVENNKFDGYTNGIVLTPRNGDTVRNLTIQKNLIDSIYGGYYITMTNPGQFTGVVYDSVKLQNNTFISHPSHHPTYAVDFPYPNTGSINHFDFINNVCSGAQFFLRQGGSVAMNNLTVKNNDFYNNDVAIESYVGPTMVNYVYSGNITSTPTFTGDYIPAIGSALIDGGINVGLSFSGSAPDIGYNETGSNLNPVANAGADSTVAYPRTTVNVIGSGTDADGSISTYSWTQISGPSLASIASVSSASTLISVLVPGTYIFQLTVTDNLGASATDTVSVFVEDAPAILRKAKKKWKK